MDKYLYVANFIISTALPVSGFTILKKKGLLVFIRRELCAFVSYLLTILLINLQFYLYSRFSIAMAQRYREFHEVFWLIPPVATYVICIILEIKGVSKNRSE